MAEAVAVNWEDYFHKIQRVCPWSWAAWQQQKIDFKVWQGGVDPLEAFEARVYTVNLNKRRLKKLCKKLDDPSSQYEWLWSTPSYGPMATPVPCLIQQDRARLAMIRKAMVEKYNK